MTVENRIDETLSAVMDGEASEFELRRVLKEVGDNPELRNTWQRYQLASAAIKRDLPPQCPDLSARISAALEQEPSHKRTLTGFYQNLGKVAVAASVTVAAVLGVQQIQTDPFSSAPAVPVASEDSAPTDSGNAQFQFPAGIDIPDLPVNAHVRTASADRQISSQARPTVLVTARPLDRGVDEQAIKDYFSMMMERHTENSAFSLPSHGSLPLARLPQGDAGQ